MNFSYLLDWLTYFYIPCFHFAFCDLGDRHNALISALIEYSNSEWRNDSSFSDVSEHDRQLCHKNYVILYFLYFLIFIAITKHRKHPLIKVYAAYDHRRQGRWIKNESCPVHFKHFKKQEVLYSKVFLFIYIHTQTHTHRVYKLNHGIHKKCTFLFNKKIKLVSFHDESHKFHDIFVSMRTLPSLSFILTRPDVYFVSWCPFVYTVFTVPSGYSRLLNWAVCSSLWPLLNSMILLPSL